MTATRAILLAATRCNDPARTDDWGAWYDDVHLPDLVRAGGAKVATRFELTQKPVPGMPSIGFSHLAIYEFAGGDTAELMEATLARDRELRELEPGRGAGLHPNHCVIAVDALVAHGRWADKPEPSSDLRGHILAYVMCNQPAREPEWDAWYDATHLPDMMESGAFAAATRWVRGERSPYGANHVTLYDVVGRSVEQAVEQSAGVMPAIAAAGRKLDCHAGATTLTLVPSGKYGGAGFRAR